MKYLRSLTPALMTLALMAPRPAEAVNLFDVEWVEGTTPGFVWLLHVPETQPGAQYPLFIYLHGAGQGGGDNRRHVLETPGPSAVIASEARRQPIFIFAPQQNGGASWAGTAEATIAMIEAEVLDRYPVDRDRIYLTGTSMGGNGTWALARTRPDLFAAIAPQAGWIRWNAGVSPAEVASLQDIPVWNMHANTDQVVPVRGSDGILDALRTLPGRFAYTRFELGFHAAWAEFVTQTPVIPWMLQQRRGVPAQGQPRVRFTEGRIEGGRIHVAGTAPRAQGVSQVQLRIGGGAWADARSFERHTGQALWRGSAPLAGEDVVTAMATAESGSVAGRFGGEATYSVGEIFTGAPAAPGDAQAPLLAITGPTTAPRFTSANGRVDLSGQVKDDQQVAEVTWTNDRGGQGTLSGGGAWTGQVDLQPGPNTITVSARDAAGNLAFDRVVVTYRPGATNQGPSVSAGLDRSATVQRRYRLDGAVQDDGLPGAYRAMWIQTAGPAPALLCDPASVDTDVVFPQPGTYTFRLEADDGAAQASDEVTIAVHRAVAPTDLARGGAASASALDTAAGAQADYAIDDNPFTVMATPPDSADPDQAWWQVDLGSAHDVSAVQIEWRAYAEDFDIALSTDGSTFTTAATVQDGQGGDEWVHFPPTTARYVRLVGRRRCCRVTNRYAGYEIIELRVYAAGAPADNAGPAACIRGPAAHAVVNGPVSFVGAGVDPEDGALGAAGLFWRSDVDGELGTGATLDATLSPGLHFVTLTARDAGGAEATSAVPVRVTDFVQDDLPPGRIADLSAAAEGGEVVLRWTATGADGASGAASAYDLRYATSPVTDPATFANATAVEGEPAPAAAGSAETFRAAGLTPGATYHFALVTLDAAGNRSPPSNSAEVTLPGDPSGPDPDPDDPDPNQPTNPTSPSNPNDRGGIDGSGCRATGSGWGLWGFVGLIGVIGGVARRRAPRR